MTYPRPRSGQAWLIVFFVTLLGFAAGSGTLAQSNPISGSPDLGDQIFHDRFEGPSNEPPLIEPIPDQSVAALSSFSYQVEATDAWPPWDVLSYALDQAPAAMGIDAQGGVISWVPTEAQIGQHPVRVRVSDLFGGVAIEDFQITVLDPKNRTPTLEPIADRSILVGQVLSIQPVASDPDLPNDELSFSLEDTPPGMSLATASGLITWAPADTQIGQWPLTLTVTDLAGLSDSTSFTVTVTGPGSPPSIEAIPDQSLLVGALLDITAEAADPDLPDDELTFSLPRAPQGMSIHAQTGRITWTPGTNRVGAHDVTVQVRDQIGLFDFTDFVVQVRAPNQAPVALDDEYRVRRGDTLTVPAPGVVDNDFDPDGDPITAELLTGPNRGVLDFRADGSFDYTPGVGHPAFEAELVDSFREMVIDGSSRNWRVTRGTVVAGDLTGNGRSELLSIGQHGAPGLSRVLTALTFNEDDELELLWHWTGDLSATPDRDFAMWRPRDPVIGDLDGDGVPEVITPGYCRGEILVFSNLGEPLVSSQAGRVPQPGEGDSTPDCEIFTASGLIGRLALVDLDGDGFPEIVFNGSSELRVFKTTRDGDGRLDGVELEWTAEAPNFGPGGSNYDYAIADVNLDGRPNIWFGGALFDADGTVLWSKATNPLSNDWMGEYAVANLNDDPFAELIYWGTGDELVVLDHEGNCLWQVRMSNSSPSLDCPTPLTIPNFSPGFRRGGLMVGDIAGDGVTRIVIGARSNTGGVQNNGVVALNPDGSLFWVVPTVLSSGTSVRPNMVNAFDFTGNGVMELVVTGVNGTVVLDGRNGNTLWEIPADDDNPGLGTSTGQDMLYSIIVDLDGDGGAELVISSQGSFGLSGETATGLFVYRDPQNRWMPTRGIWNQWAYSITNVNPDGSIPSPAQPNWRSPGLNNYRVNALPVAERTGAVLVDSFREIIIDGVPRPWRVNRGSVVAGDLTGNGRSELLAIGQRQPAGNHAETLTAVAFNEDDELELLWVWDGVPNNVPDLDFAMRSARDPVIGDLDGDGISEVVVAGYCRGEVLVFSNLGEPLVSTQAGRVPQPGEGEQTPDCQTIGGGGQVARLALVDLTGNGRPEIITTVGSLLRVFASTVENGALSDLSLLWEAQAPNFSPGGREWDYAIADVNLDGRPNIWFGGALFDVNGNVLWSQSTNPVGNNWMGMYAVANLNDDPFAELIYWGNGPDLIVLDHQGHCLWQARKSSTPNPSPTLGCPSAVQIPDLPTASPGFRTALLVADITGDGKPRIVIGNRSNSDGELRNRVIAFNPDGTPLWSVPALLSSGLSVRVNQINAFDFTGNGVMELVVTGVNGTVVLDGRNGNTLWEIPADDHNPGFVGSGGQDSLYSIIVDMDGDGAAELVVSSQGSYGFTGELATGLFVYRHPENRWMPARGVWNQWAYSVTNINEDLSIPSPAERNWLTRGLNNYRVNAFMPGESGALDRFTYQVSDGELTSNEAAVWIDIRRPNRPPTFISAPVTRAGVGLDYRYRVQAVDPDPGDEATVRLDQGPPGMVLDAVGVLRWQPSAADLGDHPIILSAIDLEGEMSLQAFTLSVVEPLEVPDVLGLSQSAAEAELVAAGLQTGRVDSVYDPVVAVGLVLEQSPDAGGVVLPNDAVNLVLSLGPSPVAPNFPPDRPVESVFIEPAELVLLQGRWRQLEAFALLDDGSEHRLADPVWSASGAVQVSPQGRVTAMSAGTGTVTAEFQSFSAEIEVTVLARVPGDDQAPEALLISPADGAQISERVPVIGTVFDDNLVSYRLEIGPPGGGRWVTLAEGFESVIEAVLGHLDATLLDNGLWRLRLTVLDAGGNQSVDEISVVLDGDLKAGLFSLSFVDLDLPLAGVPIRIEREYDSRRRQPGEFGPGWRLAVRSTELRCTAPLGAGWQVARSGLSFLLVPEEEKLCTVRLADGRLERFDFRPSVTASPFVPFSLLGSSFVPRPGTQGRLVPLANTNLIITDPQPGEVVLLDDTSLNLFNPRRFRYVDRDGTETVLSLDTGIESIRDRNGNTLSFEANGIVHSSGESISFQRDPLGRIVRLVDPAGNEQHYQYGNNGDLITHVDAEGHQTRYRYNRRHGLVGVIDPLDRALMRKEYNAEGRLIRMTTAEGRVIDLSHDLVARQQILTDTDGTQTIVQYDSRGNILQVVDPDGRMTSHSYDQWDNQISTTTPDGRTSSRTFDARGNLTSRSNPLGHTVSYSWDADNNLTSRTDELGRTTQFEYDSRGNLVRVIGPDGETQLQQGFDAAGQLILRANALGETEQLGHDSRGRLTSLTDARGNTWTVDYDALGRPIGEVDRLGVARMRSFDARGFMTETVDGDGAVTGWDFDAAGKLSGVIDPLGGISVFSHDAEGRLIEQTDPLGRIRQTEWTDQDFPARRTDALGRMTETAYDALGRPTTIEHPDGSVHAVGYDADGRVISRTDARGNITSFVWDDAGRLIGQTDPLGHTVSYAYDAAGNLISQTDQRGHLTQFVYDSRNRLVSTLHPDGAVETQAWNAADRLIRRTDALGRQTHFDRDANGNLVKVIDALGGETRYGHDAENRMVSQIDANGNVTAYTYNAEGRLTGITWPDGSGELREYDAAGQLVSVERPGGGRVEIERDIAGQILERRIGAGEDYAITWTATGMMQSVSDSRGITEYLHDARDRLLAEILPDGSRIDYSYDADGHLVALAVQVAGEDSADEVVYSHDALGRLISMSDATGTTSINWDPAGNLNRIEQPNGVVTEFSHDARNRITHVRVHLNDIDLARHDYSYNLAGEPLSVVMLDGSRIDWQHDALGRLVRETRRDAEDEVVFDERHVLDSVGNRLERVDELTGTVETYVYDISDRLLSDGAGSYVYDADGNLTQATGPGLQRSYQWDADGRLIGFADGIDPSRNRSYSYDHLGHRVVSSGAMGTVGYVNALINPTGWVQTVAEISPNGQRQASLRFGPGLINQERDGQTRFHHADRLGSQILLTNAAGQVTDRYAYTAYGETWTSDGSFANPIRFAGERLDAERDQYWLRARHYDPRQGRFLSRDPFLGLEELPLSRHRYLYAHASPVMHTDPSGMLSLANFSVTYATIGDLQKSYSGMLLKTYKEARAIGNEFLVPGVRLREYSLMAMTDPRTPHTAAQHAFRTFETSQMIIADALGMVVAAGAKNARETLATGWLPTVKLKVGRLSWNLTSAATDLARGQLPSGVPSLILPDKLEKIWKASKGIHEVVKAVKEGKDVDTATMNAVIDQLP